MWGADNQMNDLPSRPTYTIRKFISEGVYITWLQMQASVARREASNLHRCTSHAASGERRKTPGVGVEGVAGRLQGVDNGS